VKPFTHSPGLGFRGFFDAACLRNVNAVAVHHFHPGQVGCFVFNRRMCSSFPLSSSVPNLHTAALRSSLKLAEIPGAQTSLSFALAAFSFPPPETLLYLHNHAVPTRSPKPLHMRAFQILRMWDVCAFFTRRDWRALSSDIIYPIHKSRGRDINQFSFPSVDPKRFDMSEGAGFIFILQKGKLRSRVSHIAQLASQGGTWGCSQLIL